MWVQVDSMYIEVCLGQKRDRRMNLNRSPSLHLSRFLRPERVFQVLTSHELHPGRNETINWGKLLRVALRMRLFTNCDKVHYWGFIDLGDVNNNCDFTLNSKVSVFIKKCFKALRNRKTIDIYVQRCTCVCNFECSSNISVNCFSIVQLFDTLLDQKVTTWNLVYFICNIMKGFKIYSIDFLENSINKSVSEEISIYYQPINKLVQ